MRDDGGMVLADGCGVESVVTSVEGGVVVEVDVGVRGGVPGIGGGSRGVSQRLCHGRHAKRQAECGLGGGGTYSPVESMFYMKSPLVPQSRRF